MNRILIAEDEPRLASFLEKGLKAGGYTTFTVSDGKVASMIARDEEFDLLILDVGLPTMDGFQVLREIRTREQRLPVIILTARDEIADKVTGLDIGADDYMTKPFRFEELLARVRARLRTDGGRPAPTRLAEGAVVLDLRSRRVEVDGREIDLTAREFAVLETLMRHAGQLLSREQLLSYVWGYDHDPGSNIVDVYIGYLRRKVGDDAIETVRGMGYRLRT